MNYRWAFPKIVTGEPGLHGIGSSNNNYDTKARYRSGSRNTSNSGYRKGFASKYSLGQVRGGGHYRTDRSLDGTVLKPSSGLE
jgi:hypothetical protein